MTDENIIKLITKLTSSKKHSDFLKQCKEGEDYFRNENDIKKHPLKFRGDNPIKSADNRMSHSWHGLLVNQKTSYLYGKEPSFDVKNANANRLIYNVLGDEWEKTLRKLVINASNCGISWLHYWTDKDKKFQYGIVPSVEVIPIYSKDLKQRLTGLIRCYTDEDENGKIINVYEYWDDKECVYFKAKGEKVESYNKIKDKSNRFNHSFGSIPFIYFNNNSILQSDLYMYKDLVDQFDKVMSGFANDIEDVQEVVFVLEGYGGEELEEFMRDLKDFKAVKVDSNGDVKSIKAEIPVEARDKFLDSIKRAIFLFGMGVNPDKESFGDSSGVALKFMYSLLELKASQTRVEFDSSLKYLIRAILKHELEGFGEETEISITYYKNMVTNDKEVVEILSKSGKTISEKTKTKNHPYVDSLDDEIKELEKEARQEFEDYGNLEV